MPSSSRLFTLFERPFESATDTAALNANFELINKLLSGNITDVNISPDGISTGSIAPGSVGDDELSSSAPSDPTSISIVGSLDAVTNIRQANVTWVQPGTVEAESWELRWREQGTTVYLYEQVGVQDFTIKDLRPVTTYEIGVEAIGRTGLRSGYPADTTHLTGAGEEPPTVNLIVDKLEAGTLTAEVLLSGNIRTADSGKRVVIDSTGIALYNVNDDIVFQMETATGAASWDTSGDASGTRVMIDDTGIKLFGTAPGTINTVPTNVFPVGNVGTNDSTTSLVMVKPTGVASGHVLLASVANTGGTTRSITPPTDWVLLDRQGELGIFAQAVYYKVAGGSEPASYTWTFDSACDARGIIVAYSGVDTTTPIDDFSGDYSSSATGLIPDALDPTVPNGMFVAFYATNPGTASARILGSDAMVPANAAQSSAAVAVATWAGRELIPTTDTTEDRAAANTVAACPFAGHHVLLRPQQTFINNTELSASSGQAIFQGYVTGALLSGSQFRTATEHERIEISPLYADDPAGGTAIKLYAGSDWNSLFSPAATITPVLLNETTNDEQVGLRFHSGSITTLAGTGEANTSAIQLLSGRRDEALQGSYINLLGRNIQIGGNVAAADWASYGSAAGVVLWEPIQGGTEPSSNPGTNQILTWQPTTGGGGGFRGRNSHGDIWPWGPIRAFVDTGSDTNVAAVYTSYETMATDCAVTFTTRTDNALVYLVGTVTFDGTVAGWGGAVAVIADGTTTITNPSFYLEAQDLQTMPLNWVDTVATAGTSKTYRIRVAKLVGAGTLTVFAAQLTALVIG